MEHVLVNWLAQQPENAFLAAVAFLIGAIVVTLATAVILMARHKHKVTHISGFYDRKAKKGEIEKGEIEKGEIEE